MLSVISLLLNPTDWKYQYSNRLNGNPHSSTLAWKIPWTEEPGRLQSMELQRVGYGWVTSFSLAGSSGMVLWRWMGVRGGGGKGRNRDQICHLELSLNCQTFRYEFLLDFSLWMFNCCLKFMVSKNEIFCFPHFNDFWSCHFSSSH